MLKGLDMEGTRALAEALSIPVIASGGLAGMADIEALLKPENRRIAGRLQGEHSMMAGLIRRRRLPPSRLQAGPEMW